MPSQRSPKLPERVQPIGCASSQALSTPASTILAISTYSIHPNRISTTILSLGAPNVLQLTSEGIALTSGRKLFSLQPLALPITLIWANFSNDNYVAKEHENKALQLVITRFAYGSNFQAYRLISSEPAIYAPYCKAGWKDHQFHAIANAQKDGKSAWPNLFLKCKSPLRRLAPVSECGKEPHCSHFPFIHNLGAPIIIS